MDIRITNPLCYSAIGQKPNQEDTLFPIEGKATADTRIFMVCDGMGGHENGEVASACVAETIGKITSALPVCSVEDMKGVFEIALAQAYKNLDALDTAESSRKMGTTLTFLALCTDGVLTAHIGDSRIYQFRPGKGIMFQTRDHSLVNELVTAGELTELEAKTFPQRNVITRAVQPHQEYPAQPAYNVLTDIQKGDIFLLCCDGVVEQLDNDDLISILLAKDSLQNKVSRIKEECAKRKTKDNNTCYLIEISEVKGACPIIINKVNSIPCNTISKENYVPCEATKNATVAPVRNEKRNYMLWIGVLLLAFFAILLIALFSRKVYDVTSDKTPAKTEQPKKDATPTMVEETEQIQGTIQRHK